MNEPKSLSPVIFVDEEKCINCHTCIAVCPVKICQDGSGETVSIIHDLCIGCGNCIHACSHGARKPVDDFPSFIRDIEDGVPMFAIAAPAVAANFPGQYKHLFGWLRHLGVEEFFDVSFGAELTVRTYLEYINEKKPDMVIAQPCPAIVSYIEIYQPELIPYLAPADSPMLHTLKMIKRYHPELRNYKSLVLSPCLAKKREFEATGMGDYNVTYVSISEFIEKNHVDLSNYPEVDFCNPPAERAVQFSSPGGLMATVERDSPDLVPVTRKIEGPEIIYDYLKELPGIYKKGMNPTLIDCLNCEKGCNCGPGTLNQNVSIDEVEYHIKQRVKEACNEYCKPDDKRSNPQKEVRKVLNDFWEPNLYTRSYENRSLRNNFRIPDKEEIDEIYVGMHKSAEADFLDCPSCGYHSCEKMAHAIFNGLNKESNCHRYREKVIVAVTMEFHNIYEKFFSINEKLKEINRAANTIGDAVHEQSSALTESAATVEEMMTGLQNLSRISSEKDVALSDLTSLVREGEIDMKRTVDATADINESVKGIAELLGLIEDVAGRTSLLSINAAIEAARAGSAGAGFAVVSSEIKKLAEAASNNTDKVSEVLVNVSKQVKATMDTTEKTGGNINLLAQGFIDLAGAIKEMICQLSEMSVGSHETVEAISALKNHNDIVSNETDSIIKGIESFGLAFEELSHIAERGMGTISALTQGMS